MADITKAINKIDKVLLTWYSTDTVMLGVWCLVGKEPCKKQKSMGIDSRSNPPTIKFNPNFVNSISKERLEFVMASEGFKLLLKHPTTRLLHPKKISSLASNVTINQVFNHSMRHICDETFNVTNFMRETSLKPNKYFEEYFRNIIDQVEYVDAVLAEQFEKGEGDDGVDGDGYQKVGTDALKDYFDPNGNSNDEWGENTILEADIEHFVNDRKDDIKSWGKHTGDALGEIVAANTPKISYKEILRRFNSSIISTLTISSRMKVNRRYDLISPGYRRKLKCNLIFAIDVSGSMSDEDLKEGFTIINSICRHANITYMLFDTEIKSIEKNYKKAKQTFKVTGRGGTDFQEVIDYANEHKADGMVIYTDGYASAPSKPKNAKVMWLLHSKDQYPPVDWGFKAWLDREE